MSKELESAIRYVSECLEQDDNPDHCDIREILAAARQTLGRADDSEPFTLADWEALRYRRYSDGIGTESGGVIHYVAHLGRSSLTLDSITLHRYPTKHEARTLLEILCGKEPG